MSDFKQVAGRSKDLAADEHDGIRSGICHYCRLELPWPGQKEAKVAHRIIGLTAHDEPLCNWCYEAPPAVEKDWREDAARGFEQRHKGDGWGVLLSTARSLKGASRADCSDFMAMLKDEARKAGGKVPKPTR